MSDHAQPAALHEGMVVGTRFRLVRPLGQGGMGSVWVAWHTTLAVDVAIKFIDAALGARDDVLSRFAQEARTAARIQSPHVVSILDYGSDEWRRPYIAMELLRGEPLSDKLEREGALSPEETANIVTQACRGLSKAHAAGVVHRDLKPENLFLCPDDDGYLVKIVDFGIARAESPLAESSHKTGTGQLLGTPLYMSPEQALGKSGIDLRSDLYSLAVVAYRCVTGRLPFESDALGALIVAISTQAPPPPSSIRGDLPTALDAWFRRALDKQPEGRVGSARELAESFAAACRSGPALAHARTLESPVRVATPVAGASGTFSGASATHNDEPIVVPTHRPSGALVAAVAIVLVAGVAAAFAARGHGADAPQASGVVALRPPGATGSGAVAESAPRATPPPPEPAAPSAMPGPERAPPSPSAAAPVSSPKARAGEKAKMPLPAPRATPRKAAPGSAPANDYGL